MAVLYHPSLDPSRVYYGTDTRALELLIGAALAMVWPSRRLHARIAPRARGLIEAAGRRRPGRDRPDVLAHQRVLAVPLPRRVRPARPRLGPRGRLPRPPRFTARADRRLQADALDRRTLLRHLPLDPADRRPHLAPGGARSPTCCARSSRSPRSSPSRSSPGATSRTRSATAPWAGCGHSGGPGGWRRERVSRRGWAVVSAAALVVALAIAGLAGVGVSNDSNAIGAETVAKTVTAKRRPQGAAGDLLQSGRPHRRLDLGGARLRTTTCPIPSS